MTASAVLLESLGNGTIIDVNGNALTHQVYVYQRGTTTQVSVFTSSAMSSTLTQPLTTGTNGAEPGGIPGWVAGEQEIDLYDSTASLRMSSDPVSAGDVGAAAFDAAGTATSDVATETSRAETAEATLAPLFTTMVGAAAADGFLYDPETYLSVVDPIFKIGYNPGRQINTESQWYLGIEGNYKIAANTNGYSDGVPHLTHEFYINYESPDGSSVVNFRPIFASVLRDDNTSHSAHVIFDIGTKAFPYSQLQVNGGSTAIALFTPTGLYIQTGMNLEQGGVPVMQNSGLLLEAGKGYYYQGQTNLTTSATFGNGTLRLSPVFIDIPCTIEDLFIDFTVAGDAPSVYVPCLYADNGSMYPGALLASGPAISTGTGNAGTVATGGTPGVYATTISQTVTPGWYWVGGVVQGVTSVQPTLREGAFGAPAVGSNSLPSAGAQQFGYSQSSVTGTLPSTFTATVTPTAIVPRVGFQVA